MGGCGLGEVETNVNIWFQFNFVLQEWKKIPSWFDSEEKTDVLSKCSLIFQQEVERNLALISSLCMCSKRNSCMFIFHRASVSMKLARKWFTVYWLQILNLCILLMELIRKMGLSPGFFFLSYFLPTLPWQRFIFRSKEEYVCELKQCLSPSEVTVVCDCPSVTRKNRLIIDAW